MVGSHLNPFTPYNPRDNAAHTALGVVQEPEKSERQAQGIPEGGHCMASD